MNARVCPKCGSEMQLTREVEGETIIRRYWWCLDLECGHEEKVKP